MLGEGYIDAHALEVIRMDRKSGMSDEDRRWWEMQAPVSIQCEVRSAQERCQEVAKYVLTFRGKVGYTCEHDLAPQVVSLSRFGPVLVEKLP